jgi:hypothetical protein
MDNAKLNANSSRKSKKYRAAEHYGKLLQTVGEIDSTTLNIRQQLESSDFDSVNESEISTLAAKLLRLGSEASLSMLRNWTSKLDEARSIVKADLLMNLPSHILPLFESELMGNCFPGHPDSIKLSGAIIDILKKGFEKSLNPFSMTLKQARWVVIEHTFYQMRGSCPEDGEMADTLEKSLEAGTSVPEKALLYASCFLIDQFISSEGLNKKYDTDIYSSAGDGL